MFKRKQNPPTAKTGTLDLTRERGIGLTIYRDHNRRNIAQMVNGTAAHTIFEKALGQAGASLFDRDSGEYVMGDLGDILGDTSASYTAEIEIDAPPATAPTDTADGSLHLRFRAECSIDSARLVGLAQAGDFEGAITFRDVDHPTGPYYDVTLPDADAAMCFFEALGVLASQMDAHRIAQTLMPRDEYTGDPYDRPARVRCAEVVSAAFPEAASCVKWLAEF